MALACARRNAFRHGLRSFVGGELWRHVTSVANA
jgi:hypothetical protein